MKILVTFLVLLFFFLQFRLWVERDGVAETWTLHREIAQVEMQDQKLVARNDTLAAEVKNLKNGTQAIEERARTELGMIKPGETYYQIITAPKSSYPNA